MRQKAQAKPEKINAHFYIQGSRIGGWFKRVFDIVVACSGLLLLSPLLGLIALWIKHDSPGPVFYRGLRAGKRGKHFYILKFRTMREIPESYAGPRVTAQDDPRITHLGRFLRDSKLNELPQLINVLKGEMSLVGPRPEDLIFVEHYNEEQREVLSIRPGITSLASVIYSDEEKMLKMVDVTDNYIRSILPKKLRLDLIYVRNQSFLLDLDILFRTFLVFIPRFRKATPLAEDILLGPFRLLRRLLSWFTIDGAIALIAISLSILIWRAAGPLNIGISRAIFTALLITLIFTIVNWVTGVQRVQWRYASASEAVGVIISTIVSTGIVILINFLSPASRVPYPLLIVAGLFALTGFLFVRYRRRLVDGLSYRIQRFRSAPLAAREKVLVVGAGEAGQLTLWLLQNSAAAKAFHVVGVVDDDLEKLGTMVHRVPVLGMCDRIPEIVQQEEIGMIVYAIHSIDPERRRQILKDCWTTNIRTVVAPDILTFMRGGEHSDDRMTWSPSSSSEDQPDPESIAISEQHLQNRIQVLAELARLGDYATLTEQLELLDREIGETQSSEAIQSVDVQQSKDQAKVQVPSESSS